MQENKEPKRKPIWLKIILWIFSSLLIIVLVICISGVYVAGFSSRYGLLCKHEKGFSGKAICGTISFYNEMAPYFRSIPSDEEMIAHFYKHRTDFEQLVKIYQRDTSVPALISLAKTPEVATIRERINVTYTQPHAPFYTLTSLYFQHNHPEVRNKYDLKLYKGYYHTLYRPEILGKGYYQTFFPTQNLCGALNEPGGDMLSVYKSLNKAPQLNYNCVLRQFEPQWFIQLCEG